MTADTFFQATNTLALVAWITLVLTFLAGPVGFLVHILGRGALHDVPVSMMKQGRSDIQ